MATIKKHPKTVQKELLALRKENAALRRQLRKATDDSEAYRKACQAYAIAQITPAQLKEWDREIEDSGRTILDVIEEVKRGRVSDGRAGS